MLRIFIIPVIIPFLKIPFFSYLIRIELRQHTVNLVAKTTVDSEFRGSVACIRQTLPDHSEISRTSIEGSSDIAVRRDILIFRRGRRRSDEITLLPDKPAKTKVSRTFQHRIILFKKRFVSVKKIMLPDMARKPRTTHIPISPSRIASVKPYRIGHRPDVGIMAETPATIHTIVMTSRGRSAFRKIFYPREQRCGMEFAKSCHLSRPIILLDIYISSIVAAPRRKDIFVPKPL